MYIFNFKGGVPVLVEKLSSPNLKICEPVIWCLANIAADSVQCRDLVLESGALPKIVSLFDTEYIPLLYRQVSWAILNLCQLKPPPSLEKVFSFLLSAECSFVQQFSFLGSLPSILVKWFKVLSSDIYVHIPFILFHPPPLTF